MKSYKNIHPREYPMGTRNRVSQKFVNSGPASWETRESHETFQQLRATIHLDARWVDLVLVEQGMKTRRECHFTLSPEQAEALVKLIQLPPATVL